MFGGAFKYLYSHVALLTFCMVTANEDNLSFGQRIAHIVLCVTSGTLDLYKNGHHGHLIYLAAVAFGEPRDLAAAAQERAPPVGSAQVSYRPSAKWNGNRSQVL